MDFFTLFLVSIPVFYVWGFISFVNLLNKGNKKDIVSRRIYLETAISDLKKETTENSEKKLIDLLSKYQEELNKLPAQTVASTASDTASLTPSVNEVLRTPATSSHQSEASIQNWYKDNSINLLLYLGAFLIIVSATIFVSVPETSGISKSLVVSLLTLVFLFCGLWFYKMPRIKNAGVAFTAVGALLIPISGLGWYNFVFKFTHVPFGLVWIMTSFIGLFVYIILARYFKSVFYSYVTGFSSLSFILAFFNMQGLQNDYYVLGAILSSIVLLMLSIYFKNKSSDEATLFWEPFSITANITLPVAIAYALFLTSQTVQFTLQSTASVFLGCIFYLLSYRFFKKSEYLFVAQILFTLGLIYLGFWLHMELVKVLYLLMASLCANLALVSYFNNRGRNQQANLAALFSIIKPTVIFAFAWTNDIASIHLLVFTIITMLLGLVLTYIRKNALYLSLTSIFFSIACYILLFDQFNFSDKPYVLGIVYTVIATGFYTLATHFKTKKHELGVFVFSSAYFFFLSTVFIADAWRYQLFNATAMTIIAYSAAYQFAKKEVVYLGNALLAFTIYSLLQFMHAHIEMYPLVFVTLSFAFYLASTVVTKEPHGEMRNSGLLGAVLSPLIFGLYSFSFYDYTAPNPHTSLEFYSLISSYATFLLYGFDASSRKSKAMGYTASVIGLLTYLWQINYLGFTETQYYTFVIGAYFFTLAFIQRRNRNQSLKTLFDVLATFFFMVPTWFQTFGDNSAIYALILGMIGVFYLVYSITYQEKLYRYTGILAIVLAVVSQSKWAIIGLAGLFFLGFAIYLLIFRKEDTIHKKA